MLGSHRLVSQILFDFPVKSVGLLFFYNSKARIKKIMQMDDDVGTKIRLNIKIKAKKILIHIIISQKVKCRLMCLLWCVSFLKKQKNK
jgi:hypothetical protein